MAKNRNSHYFKFFEDRVALKLWLISVIELEEFYVLGISRSIDKGYVLEYRHEEEI